MRFGDKRKKWSPKRETIKFRARCKTDFEVHDRPYPAESVTLDWWKTEPPYNPSPENPDGNKLLIRNGISNATFKKCRPMLDALNSGYIIPLWADVNVEQTGQIPLITWRTKTLVFSIHGDSSRRMPAPPGYDQVVFKYENTWIPMTPPGYSVLVTAPFGQRNLPFHAIPAVIDSDKSNFELVFPMWIRSGLEGIVEKGTPMVQMIPFKRSDWKMEFDYYEDGEYWNVVKERTFNTTIVGHYVKNAWSRKSYK